MTSYLIIIHNTSLIFTIMQIKPRLPGEYANCFDPPRDPGSDLWPGITHHARDLWPQTGSTHHQNKL